MCFFIIADLPTDVIALPEGLYLSECRYVFPAEPDRQLVCITDGNCSCNLYRRTDDKDSKLRAKYAKRGWSASKIERAMADRAAKSDAGSEVVFEQWLAAVAGIEPGIRIFVHWDSAPQNWHVQHPPMLALDLGRLQIPDEGWVVIL